MPELPNINRDYGLSMRDYFAALALQGIVDRNMLENAMTNEQVDLHIMNAAALAYRLSDAMLYERDKDLYGLPVTPPV